MPAQTPDKARRGHDTRDKLLLAAAQAFNKDGYFGTDSNKIARGAGFSPGTFYKHFGDKREAFLAVYELWIEREREALAPLAQGGSSADAAGQLVARLSELYQRWRGFRASSRLLAATDEGVRKFQREQRGKLMTLLSSLRGGRKGSRERDALLLFALERGCDALADGEADDLRLTKRALVRELERMVAEELSGR